MELNDARTGPSKKYGMYKTAFWTAIGNYVRLIKWHPKGYYYEVETIAGERANATLHELSNFVL